MICILLGSKSISGFNKRKVAHRDIYVIFYVIRKQHTDKGALSLSVGGHISVYAIIPGCPLGCSSAELWKLNNVTACKTQHQQGEREREGSGLVKGLFHHPDLTG